MRFLRFCLLVLALSALATQAPAQYLNGDGVGQGAGRGVTRGGDGGFRQRGGGFHGRASGGRGFGARGFGARGFGGRGFGLLPGLLLPAIAAGARAAPQPIDDEPPIVRRPHRPRKPVPPPHLARVLAPRPVIARVHVSRPKPTIARTSVARAAAPAANPGLLLPPAAEKRFLVNEILVAFRTGTSERRIAALARRHHLELAQSRDLTLIGLRIDRLRFADRRPLREVMTEFSRLPQVTLVEPHYIYALQDEATNAETQAPPSIESPAPPAAGKRAPPAAKEQAPPAAKKKPEPPVEEKPEPSPSYAAALLRLDAAHRIVTGHGVRIAVIDSLIDAAHPEIVGSVAGSFDPLGGPDIRPQPHGTGMAGAITGHRQIAGAAPGAQILAVRAFDGAGASARAVGLDILSGIDWAAAQKAQVINMSFAGPADPLLEKMLAAAAKKGIVLIAAAGNDGPDAAPLYPGADPNVIAVSAVDASSQVYANANRGPYVALAAPGVDVLVAAPSAAYDLSTGTSVACAEVSGVAALLLEKHPDLDGPALRRLLQDTAKALAGARDAGAGVADAEAAVMRLP